MVFTEYHPENKLTYNPFSLFLSRAGCNIHLTKNSKGVFWFINMVSSMYISMDIFIWPSTLKRFHSTELFFPLTDALIGCNLLLRSKIAADHTLKTHLWYPSDSPSSAIIKTPQPIDFTAWCVSSKNVFQYAFKTFPVFLILTLSLGWKTSQTKMERGRWSWVVSTLCKVHLLGSFKPWTTVIPSGFSESKHKPSWSGISHIHLIYPHD